MDDATRIVAKLNGSPPDRKRRTHLLTCLLKAFAEGGPDATALELTRRLDALEDAFATRLKELKKQL